MTQMKTMTRMAWERLRQNEKYEKETKWKQKNKGVEGNVYADDEHNMEAIRACRIQF